MIHKAWQGLIRPRSITGNAVIRFAGVVTATTFMAITGILVARSTGADGKGVVATISYLIALIGSLATLGLGDASIVLVRGAGWSASRATSAALRPTLLLSVVAGTLVWGVTVAFPDVRDLARWSLPLTAAGVVGFALQRLLGGIAEARGEIPFAAVAYVSLAGVTTLATFGLVTAARLDAPGAVVALTVGPLVSAAALAVFLRRRETLLHAHFASEDFRSALRLGLPMELAQSIQTLSSRADMLVVYLVMGVSSAGFYSVAITVGEIVRYAPSALAVAAFPAIADEPRASAHLLARRVTRTTVAAAAVAALGLGALVPWLVPALFGSGFTPSIVPAQILLVGGVAGSTQWGLCRVAAAVGHPGVLLRSHAASLLAMLTFDAWLIPLHGLTGAAVASVIGPCVGVWVALRGTRDVFNERTSLRWLVPGNEELALLAQLPRRLLSGIRDALR